MSDLDTLIDTYFQTMAFSLALYRAFPFIQITCTPLVFSGVGIRTYNDNKHKVVVVVRVVVVVVVVEVVVVVVAAVNYS